MRDAACQGAHGVHFLGMIQFSYAFYRVLGGPFFFGYVADDARDDRPLLGWNYENITLDLPARSVGAGYFLIQHLVLEGRCL